MSRAVLRTSLPEYQAQLRLKDRGILQPYTHPGRKARKLPWSADFQDAVTNLNLNPRATGSDFKFH